MVIATSGTAAALAEACAAILAKSGKEMKSVRKSARDGRDGFAPTPLVQKLAAKLSRYEPARAGGGSGHRSAACGDHHGGRAGIRGAAGELQPGGISVFAAGTARWNAGADAGGAGSACGCASAVRDRTVGVCGGNGRAIRRRYAAGGAGARPCRAALSRSEFAAPIAGRVRDLSGGRSGVCGIRESSSITRGITGIRSTLCRCRRCTGTRRCSGRLFQPLRDTLARAARSRTTERLRNIPPRSTKTCSAQWCCYGSRWR